MARLMGRQYVYTRRHIGSYVKFFVFFFKQVRLARGQNITKQLTGKNDGTAITTRPAAGRVLRPPLDAKPENRQHIPPGEGPPLVKKGGVCVRLGSVLRITSGQWRLVQ